MAFRDGYLTELLQLLADMKGYEPIIKALIFCDDAGAVNANAAKVTKTEITLAAIKVIDRAKDNPAVIEALLRALKNDNTPIRNNAIAALERKYQLLPFDHFTESMQSVYPKVRAYAARALGKTTAPRSTEAVEPLIAARTDSDKEVRRYAVESLGTLKDPRAVAPLIAALKDNYEGARVFAAKSLGILKDQRAVEPLITVLKDRDKEVRKCAAESLGTLKDPRAVDPLIAALKDSSKPVRDEAIKFIRLNKDLQVEPLIAALKSDYINVRVFAAAELGGIKDPRSTDALLATLKDNDKSVREAAVKSLDVRDDFPV